MDIQHASINQVMENRKGEMVLVEDDVLDIVRQLKEISDTLCVRWNELGEYFVIYEKCDDGVERLVTTVTELDQRVVEHIRQIDSHRTGWDVSAEIKKMDEKAFGAQQHRLAERVGEIGERLHHALRKDYQAKDRVIVPGRAGW